MYPEDIHTIDGMLFYGYLLVNIADAIQIYCLAMQQSVMWLSHCQWSNETGLNNMDKYTTWIHFDP